MRLAVWSKFPSFACPTCGATLRRNWNDVVGLWIGVGILAVAAVAITAIVAHDWNVLQFIEGGLGLAYVSARCLPRFDVEDPPL